MQRVYIVSIVLSVILGLSWTLISPELKIDMAKLAPMLVFTPILSCFLRRLRLFLMAVGLVGYCFLLFLFSFRIMDLTTASLLGFELVVGTIALIMLSDGADKRETITSIFLVISIIAVGCLTSMIYAVAFAPENFALNFNCALCIDGDRFPKVYSDCYETHANALARHVLRSILMAVPVVLGMTILFRRRVLGMVRSPFRFSGACLLLFIVIGSSLLPFLQALYFDMSSLSDTWFQLAGIRHAYRLLTAIFTFPLMMVACIAGLFFAFRYNSSR